MCGRTNIEVGLETLEPCSVVQFSLLYSISFAAIDFTIDPGDVTVAQNQMRNVTFRCSLSDPSLSPYWIVKFPDTQNLSTRDNDNEAVLNQRGVIYSSSNMMIPGVLMNNVTLVSCAAFVFAEGVTKISDPVQLMIAGKPIIM